MVGYRNLRLATIIPMSGLHPFPSLRRTTGMASVPALMGRIRRVRRQSKKPASVGRYEHYASEYERILEAVDDCGGEDALDELGEWAVEWTKRQKRLPTQATMREQARRICEERSVEVPDESP